MVVFQVLTYISLYYDGESTWIILYDVAKIGYRRHVHAECLLQYVD